MNTLIEDIKQQARLAGACDLVEQVTDMKSLAEVFFRPQGMEFCTKNHFPAGQTWRQLKEMGIERYGVYVDGGELTLRNPEQVALVGKTTARIVCDGQGLRKVYLLRGASVNLDAYDWVVVRVATDGTCPIIKHAHGNAIII